MRRPTPVLCLILLLLPVAAGAEEKLEYRWDLGGFLGMLARVVLPGQGEGVLTTDGTEDGRVQTELLITSASSDEGEYWHYGAIVDPEAKATDKVWSSYFFRGKRRAKEEEIDDGQTLIDIASGIYVIRRDPPTRPRRMRIWSDGKIYPVMVQPTGTEKAEFGGEAVTARRYTVRGVDEPGGRPWKGNMELLLMDDEASTPLEILYDRKWSRVKLRLVEKQAAAGDADGAADEADNKKDSGEESR